MPMFAKPSRFALHALASVTLLGSTLSPSVAVAQSTAGVPLSAATAPDPVTPYTTEKDKMSYATGVMTARQLTKNGVPFDLDVMIQGLRDGMAGGPIRMGDKELKAVLQAMQTDIARKLSNERQVKASLNRENGVIFQKKYGAQAGVTVLPGNLMYKIIKAGTGEKTNEVGTVVVKFRGTLIDGTEFDATPEGKTATIKLADVITGWREAIRRMPAGSIWEVVVPPSMAYSTRGAGSVIGPNETLIFNIELVAVVN